MPVSEKEAEAARLEAEIADVCGMVNAATARLVDLIGRVLATGSWEGWQIRSPEHWVSWKCGVSPARARCLVAMARRLSELPETKAAFDAGELSPDQVAVVCRHAPAAIDGEVAILARETTVTPATATPCCSTSTGTGATSTSAPPWATGFGATCPATPGCGR